MKNYCIFRVDKVKSLTSVQSLLKEHQRAEGYDHKRADPHKKFMNTIQNDWQTCYANYQTLLPEKVRKNAVYALDFVVSSSEPFGSAEEEELFYLDSKKYLEEHFGPCFSSAIHRDEKSTHAHFMTIPLVNGKLNARAMLGGSAQRMAEIQTDFWAEVGQKHGLERGEEKSKAQHKTVEEYHQQRKLELDEREKKLDERQAYLSDCVKTLADDYADINAEFEKQKNSFFFLPENSQEFYKKVKNAMHGFVTELKFLNEKIQKLTKKLTRFENLTSKDLHDLADNMDSVGCRTVSEYEAQNRLVDVRRRSQTRSNGFGR